MNDGRYRDLGKMLAVMALERSAFDPGTIAERMKEATDQAVDSQEVLEYVKGTRCPSRTFIPAFAKAFSLTTEERRRLAWMYTFSELPD